MLCWRPGYDMPNLGSECQPPNRWRYASVYLFMCGKCVFIYFLANQKLQPEART